MITKCQACGAEKDMSKLETYPYEEDGLTDEPIEPILEVETDRYENNKAIRALVCHECFHRLSPDMWIDQRCWDALKPVTAYGDL